MPALANIGMELAGYRLEAMIGRGGMGVVYRAHDLALDRDVALKLLVPELAEDVAFRDRFLRESRLAASLEHPNVVPIHDAGEVDGQLYIAMRLVEGTDLKAMLRDGPIEPTEALEIVEQIADALDAAHARGLVHRDVKPSNVLVTGEGHVYLADFGLTRRLGDAGEALGAANSLGSVDYVAPEQIRGDEVDGRADLYSLGCLLHECLTGAPPFRRSSETKTLFAHLQEQPPAPPGLEAVIAVALAKEPEARYGSGRELVAASRGALGLGGRRHVHWPVIVAGAGLLIVAAALLAVFIVRQGGAKASATVPPAGDGKVVRIDPATGKRLSTVAFGQDLSDVEFGAGGLWLASLGSGAIARLDPASGQLDEPISVAGAGSGPSGIASAGDLLWIVNGGDDTVRLFNARTRQFATGATVPQYAQIGCVCPGEDVPAVAEGQSLWMVNRAQYALERFPAQQATVVLTSLGAGRAPMALAIEGGVIWVVTSVAGPTLVKIDATTERVIGRIRLPPGTVPSAVAADEGVVWVADLSGDAVLRVERRLRSDSSLSQWEVLKPAGRIRVGRAPKDIVIGQDSVWVANYLDGTVSKIDPRTERVETLKVGPYPEHLALAEGGLWVGLDPP